MKSKQILKIIVDILMTVTMMLLMTYSLVYGSNPTVGEVLHEWISVGMFVLFMLHHFLNQKWSFSVFKGKYTPYRVVQTAIVVIVLLNFCGSMISRIILSRTVFSFLDIEGGQAVARIVHMLCAYWGFVFISLHLGLHWNSIVNISKRLFHKKSKFRKWIARIIGWIIAAYGFFAFLKRDIPKYMFLQIHFVFIDFDEALLICFLDYLSIMGMFVCIGHYISKLTKNKKSFFECKSND